MRSILHLGVGAVQAAAQDVVNGREPIPAGRWPEAYSTPSNGIAGTHQNYTTMVDARMMERRDVSTEPKEKHTA